MDMASGVEQMIPCGQLGTPSVCQGSIASPNSHPTPSWDPTKREVINAKALILGFSIIVIDK